MSEGRPPQTGARRPTTSMRVGTAAGRRIGTAAAPAPGTAAARGATARPGTRGGALAGGVLSTAQVRVADRPMTQQGLGGMKTAKAGQGRAVLDHSFFLGAIRSKCSELGTELSKLSTELQRLERDEATFTSYEGKATGLAKEIKALQGELADINTMQDKLNTNVDVTEVTAEREELKTINDRTQGEVDAVFAEKRKLETQLKILEGELNTERNWAQTLVQQMSSDQQRQYAAQQQAVETLMKDIQGKQHRLEELNERIAELENELQANPLKREAAALQDQIRLQEQKREALRAEIEAAAVESPERQRERLLLQVKEDNQEIARMERRITELENEIRAKQDEADADDGEEIDDDQRAKYDELVRREEEINSFLSTFSETRQQEQQQMDRLAGNVVALLEHISRIAQTSTALPSSDEHKTMQEDLAFKEKEMEKSQMTAENLEEKREKLKKDLENFDQLESKITKELAQLKAKIEKMQTELVTFRDVDTLIHGAEAHRQGMATEKQTLLIRRDVVKQTVADLAAKLDQAKSLLADNETHTQLENLEKKWQYAEKNNFIMKDFIATKEMEADCSVISKKVETLLRGYNERLKSTKAA
eukprot:m.21406 g.21406  ORF g.21406 m.21406 type:complete len:595 (+) comp3622_c0_seq2:70-1854(+)